MTLTYKPAELLRKGVECWNEWRLKNRSEKIYLTINDFSNQNLDNVNFNNSILYGINFDKASIKNSDFSGSVISDSTFNSANLSDSDFSDAKVYQIKLRGVNLLSSNLSRSNFSESDLTGANLSNSDLTRAIWKSTILEGCNVKEAKFNGIDLQGSILSNIKLNETKFRAADPPIITRSGWMDIWQSVNYKKTIFDFSDLSGYNFKRMNLNGCQFKLCTLNNVHFEKSRINDGNFQFANLSGSFFNHCKLKKACFEGAQIDKVDFSDVNAEDGSFKSASLSGANFNHANLKGVDFTNADLSNVNFSNATLTGATLANVNLVNSTFSNVKLDYSKIIDSNIEGANFNDCSIFGISIWGLSGEPKMQSNLIITKLNQPQITVDNLDVAQFIYLLISSEKIRHVVDTLAKKIVLILGRFTDERLIILETIRDELRRRDYIPILFTFENPTERNIAETVSLLAHLSRFVIADISDPRSVPAELQILVPSLPSLPIIPIIDKKDVEYGLFENIRQYNSVVKLYKYDDIHSIKKDFDKIVEIAETKANSLKKRKRVIK